MASQAVCKETPDDGVSLTQPPPRSENMAPAMTPVTVEDQAANEDDQNDDTSQVNGKGTSLPEQQVEKKKKRKKKSQAQRGPTALPKNRGSGFEEYFADPPMTPQEAMEEKEEIYSAELPFAIRIQSCIQRFRGRRRLQAKLTLLFDEYLFLGGIDTQAAAFTGLDPKELKALTPAQRREATATDIVHGLSSAGERFYDGDATRWSVDFAGIAAGFFSTSLVTLTSFDEADMAAAIEVVENFLRYVHHHDVCPEYKGDVERALRICDDAREEWPMLERLQGELPGQFNLAAAELFSKPSAGDWSFLKFKRPDNFDAKTVFYTSMALLDEPEVFEYLCSEPQDKLVVKEYDCTLQITEIQLPSEALTNRFKTTAINQQKPLDTNTNTDTPPKSTTPIRLTPLGKLLLKPSIIEDEWDDPLPSHGPFASDATITLFFETAVLANLKTGMKLKMTVGELGGGVIRFVKTIQAAVPSFYTFLPQEMMRHYKPPRENERPAPSVHDIDGAAGGMDGDEDGG